MPVKKDTLLVAFREDSIMKVSRKTLTSMCQALGIDQTQTVHLALARLREDVLGPATHPKIEDDYPPLTATQEKAIKDHAPKIGKAWKKLTSQSLF